MRTGYIYGLYCPIAKSIRYVGQSTINTATKLGLAKAHVGGDFGDWVAEIKGCGMLDLLSLVVLEDGIPEKDLTKRETYWISMYIGTGILINKNAKPFNSRRGNLNHQYIHNVFAIDSALLSKRPTLKDLVAVTGMSTRSVQLLIEDMRKGDDLKLYAPIKYNKAGKYYSYSDPSYSVLNVIKERFYATPLKAAA